MPLKPHIIYTLVLDEVAFINRIFFCGFGASFGFFGVFAKERTERKPVINVESLSIAVMRTSVARLPLKALEIFAFFPFLVMVKS